MRRVVIMLSMLLTLGMLSAETINVDGLNYKVVNDMEVSFVGYDESITRSATEEDYEFFGSRYMIIDELSIPGYITTEGRQYKVSSLSTHSVSNAGIYKLILPYTIEKIECDALYEVIIKTLISQGSFPPKAECQSFSYYASYELVSSFISTIIDQIVVPESSLIRYNSAPGWSGYDYIITGDKSLSGESYGATVFEEDGWVFNKFKSEDGKKVELSYRVRNPEEQGRPLTIPASITHDGEEYVVERIGKECFYEADYSTIYVPSSVKTLGKGSFGCCHAAEITGMEGVEKLEGQCFFSEYLKRIVYPPKMSVVPGYCFGARYWMSLDYLDLHEGIMEIPGYAFVFVGFKEVVCRSVTPPKANDGSFWECLFGKLYVPGESMDAYRSAPGWRQFEICPIPGTAIDAISAEETPAEYYTLQGIRVPSESLSPGIYLKRHGSTVDKIVRQ